MFWILNMRVLAVVVGFVGGCLQAQPTQAAGEPRQLLKMSILDLELGTGSPALAGQRYKVHYTGWLVDGTKFDSSRDRGEPLTFVQGRRQLIAGWEAGFEGMRAGGKRRLFIPYQMAYGEKGSGKTIPPKADLIFDVELMAVESVPETPAGQEFLEGLESLEHKLLAMAEALPEEKWAWRPGPGVRSFGEVLRHVQSDNLVWLSMASGRMPTEEDTKKLTQGLEAKEKEPAAKRRVIKDLGDSFLALRKAIEPMRAGTLAGEVRVFQREMTRRGLFTMFLAHASEHLGQLIAYERVNGVVPPWSAGAMAKP